MSTTRTSPRWFEPPLHHMDDVFSASDHRFVFWDSAMPQPFEARLVVDGWKLWNASVTLVLEGELREPPAAFDIRPAASDADWNVIEDMHWLDAQEEVSKGLQPPWPRSVTAAMVRTKRRKAPAVQYFLARVDGVDCAFFSAWPGDNGVGQVEDLYTLPAFRGRGIARSLMVTCVSDARARGAGPVIICARAEDTPKSMYEAMGFRPLCVQRGYLKQLSSASAAP
jgi:ribosomal protein S18 acetylase RimI-like enzyme